MNNFINSLSQSLSMGKYGFYVWTSLSISLLILLIIFVYSFKRYRNLNRQAKNLGIQSLF